MLKVCVALCFLAVPSLAPDAYRLEVIAPALILHPALIIFCFFKLKLACNCK